MWRVVTALTCWKNPDYQNLLHIMTKARQLFLTVFTSITTWPQRGQTYEEENALAAAGT